MGRMDTHYDGASMGASFYLVNSIFTQLGKIKKYNMPSIMVWTLNSIVSTDLQKESNVLKLFSRKYMTYLLQLITDDLVFYCLFCHKMYDL